MLWFTKGRRAQSVDDYETWIAGGVMPTLNAFDNGDVRTTILIIDGTRVNDVRVYDDPIIQTVISRWGTGGGNVPAVMPTLTAANNPSRSPQSTEVTAQVEAVNNVLSVVRRLTPVETERLQGFPDNWTDGQADSHRYKQMGNAVTVNVIEWIGARL